MRNLKRVLSLALASVMVVSMMVIGAGAANFDDFSDKDEIVNKEAVSVLVELGVLAGKDDGSYDPTGIITRGEMAKIICVVLNKGQDPNLGTVNSNTYTDTVGHWAAPYIEYCTTLGIVAGKGDGTFAPNDTVTASEASKMLLVALGYNAQYESMIGANWAVATNVLANKNGLYDGLTLDVSAGLTRDNAAQMMYNALDAKVVEYEYAVIPSGDSISSIATAKYRNGEPTMLEYVFDAVKVTGIVERNEYGTVTTSDPMDEGETYIDVTNNTNSNPEQTKLGDGKYNFTTSVDLLGKKIDFYAIPGTSSVTTQAKILGNAIVNAENTVVTLTSGHSSKTIVERVDDEGLDIDGDTVYVTNYSELGEKLIGHKNNVNGVEIIAIDNNDDGVAEYVLQNFEVFGKVTAYATKDDGSITVSAVSRAANYGFWDSGAGTYSKGSVKMDDSADVIGFDDVEKDDYVFAQEIGGKLYVRVAEPVELTPSSTQGNDFKADGETYKKAGTVNELNEDGATTAKDAVVIGEAANVYLDAYGYVVYVTDVDTTLDYVYVTASTEADGVDDVRAKVVFADGSTDTITVSKLDGEDITSGKISEGVYSYTVSGSKYRLTSSTESTKFTEGTITAAAKAEKVIQKSVAALNVTGVTGVKANSNTVFVVKAGSSWEVYTGIANVPTLDAHDKDGFSAYVAYSNDKYAEVVFVESSSRSDASSLENSIYVLNENPTVTKDSNGDNVYTYTVIYKGEKVEMEAEGDDIGITKTGLYLNTSVTGNNVITKAGTLTDSAMALKASAGVIELNDGKTYTVNDDTVFIAVDDEDVSVVSMGYISADSEGKDGDLINVITDKDNDSLATYVFILE